MSARRERLTGWGRTSRAWATVHAPATPEAAAAVVSGLGESAWLAIGRGRSYADARLNADGAAISTARLNRVRHFDADSGLAECEAGVTFAELYDRFVPLGFLPPANPGTGEVTVGGAVANDVHGKDHDHAGSFGDSVEWMDLLLPGGTLRRVSRERDPRLFAATVGGIGLTGLVLAAAFRLRRVPSNAVRLREERIAGLEHMFARLEEARGRSMYSVGWVDALARGAHLGRGILETADPSPTPVPDRPARRLRMPVDLPGGTLNRWSVACFNALYLRRVPRAGRTRAVPLRRFLFPLDAITDWNRMYGRRGVYQFQCVIPDSHAFDTLRAILTLIAESSSASFLAVIKTLGATGPGYLSFPLRGYTLALDFPARPATRGFIHRLHEHVLGAGGRVYLAKDGCLTRNEFEGMYAGATEMRRVLDEVDPGHAISSEMGRRLGLR